MAYVDLIMNLALLVALSILSAFVERRWPRDTFAGVLLQGFLFGAVAIIGMLRPLVLGPGLIFDGRSIIISLCALFFGHPAVSVTAAMAAAYRLALGGPGVVMGVLVILASAVIGLLARHYMRPLARPPSTPHLFFLGLAVHAAMVALMFTLPGELAISTIKRLGLPVIILYPLATILAGKILSEQVTGILNTKALQESEERYRKLFQNHAAVKLLLDPDTAAIVDANEAAEKFYGWPREKLKQMKISDINTLSPAEIRQELENARTKNKIHFDFRHRLADGSIRDVDVFSSKIEFKGKDLLHSIIHDATARKRAEESLRESQQMLATFIRHSPIYAFIKEVTLSESRVLWASDNYVEMVGIPGSQMTGKNMEDLFQPEFARKISKDDWDVVSKGEVFSLDEDLNNRNYHTIKFPITIGGKNLLAGYTIDITERKRAEEELCKLSQELEARVAQRTKELKESQLALLNVVDDLNENAKKLAAANEALEALNKELEAFAYSVSHDLRAPLRSIDGFSAALLEDYSSKIDKTGKDHLKRVRRAAQNMGELIDDLLKLSRVNKADFLPVSVNLSKMAAETANTFKKQTGRKNTKVEIQPNLEVSADSALLQIVLTNLIGNAFKFTGKNEKTFIEFGTRQEGEQNIFYVRDNGVGFDMNYANKLFAPFQRLHNFDEFEGTGIGLATVQRIIHRHGGRVWAEGEVNKGATIYFTLPERGKVTNEQRKG